MNQINHPIRHLLKCGCLVALSGSIAAGLCILNMIFWVNLVPCRRPDPPTLAYVYGDFPHMMDGAMLGALVGFLEGILVGYLDLLVGKGRAWWFGWNMVGFAVGAAFPWVILLSFGQFPDSSKPDTLGNCVANTLVSAVVGVLVCAIPYGRHFGRRNVGASGMSAS